jgi:GTP-binding protein Era
VIGKGGARLREVGTAARTQIEKLLGTRIYLDLRVKAPRIGSATQNSLAGIGF